MRRINITITLMLISIMSITCIAQKDNTNKVNKVHMPELTINKNFEKFDFKTFDAKKDKEAEEYKETLESGTFLFMSKGGSGLSYQEIPLNSLFCISKVYYPNGNVKQKGVGYVYWFETGIWYYYDENGKLIKEVDHDKPFKFTFEKVLEFCQKEKIPIVKGADVQKYGYKTYISRKISEDSDSCWWSIRWLKKPTTEETIRINGVTGKVESRVESYYGNS